LAVAGAPKVAIITSARSD